ncbi:uncharacterized protein M6B38_315385 [Iris pallida]|uniref:Uncharacterized protein n=1 Tax=Iris pallida TaxID=29817 RepID=A0AAX6HF15_IRIPA|nr:uncharacterized protein M6B38_315385 [Iris pallida]
MASTMLLHLQNLWPFSLLKTDDLKLSNQLVRGLPIPDQTKQFIFAAREPDSNAIVYILAVQNLSEQSASDAQHLIRQVQPRAVVAQVAPSALADIQAEEKIWKDDQASSVPTSYLGVLKRCLIEKVNKEQYNKVAGCQVLNEIFGIGFYGHFLAAKKAAEEVDSPFLLLESPYVSACSVDPQGETRADEQSSGSNLQPSCLLSDRNNSALYSSFRRLCLTDALQSHMVKSLIPSLELLLRKASLSKSVSEVKPGESQPSCDVYQAPPPFAESVYPLLADLCVIFNDLPAIRKAFISAQKLLLDINRGEPVDTQLVSQVHNFRIAIEGLRVALNNAGRCPINKESEKLTKMEFSELPSDEKCHVLFAQALRSQVRKFGGSVVAIVDAGTLAGLRRYWNRSVPPKIAELADNCSTHHYPDEDLDEAAEDNVIEQHTGRKRVLADKPVVAVGAGATAILGVSSLSKAVPVSTLIKVTTYKVPAILKFSLAQIRRHACTGLMKILGQSKLLAPGVASAGAKTSATFKMTVSAEKIRVVTSIS